MQEQNGNIISDAPGIFGRAGKHFTLIAFIIGFLATVINYLFIKNDQDFLYGHFVLLFIILGFIITLYPSDYWWKYAIVTGASMPAANIVLIIYDSITGRMEHNLFPVELFMSTSTGLGCALVGAFACWIIKEIFYSIVKKSSGKKDL